MFFFCSKHSEARLQGADRYFGRLVPVLSLAGGWSCTRAEPRAGRAPINAGCGAFVFGIEGDLDSSWLDGKKSSSFCGSVGFDAAAQCETKNTWLGSARARFGYAADRVLFYGTFGGAYDNIQSGVNGLVNSDKAGWVAGAGIEARSATTGRRGSNVCSSTCRTRRARPPAHAGWTPAAQPPTIPSNSTPT
jgi:hypothetical protein